MKLDMINIINMFMTLLGTVGAFVESDHNYLSFHCLLIVKLDGMKSRMLELRTRHICTLA